jgi:uncharacterized damage-inducible protein DinB
MVSSASEEVVMKSVLDTYPYWERVRKTIIQAATLIPKGKLEWGPAKGLYSFGDLLRHMVDTEEFWIQGVLQGKGGSPDRKRKGYPTVAKIFKDWDRVHQKTLATLSRMPVSSLTKKVKIEQNGKVPVGWLLWHVVEHEVHHRAHILLYLRLLGVEPPQI